MAQSEVRERQAETPVAFATRSIFGSYPSIQSVMAVGDGGKILAHELAIEPEDEGIDDEENALLVHVPEYRMFIFVRLSGPSDRETVANRIAKVLQTPCFPIRE